MNIRTRFAIAGVLSTCVVLVGASGIIVRQSTSELRRNFDTDLTARYQASAPIIASAPSVERLIDTISANSTNSGIRVVENGKETRIGDMPLHPPALPEQKVTSVKENGDMWRAFAGTIDDPTNGKVQVQMFAPTDKLNQRISVIRHRVAAVLAGSIVATALLTWIIGGYATRPLRRLTMAVRNYRNEEIPTKQGVEEVDAVGLTINELLSQLQEEHAQTRVALDTAREFSLNAVHELRTPLMSMRTDTDALLTHQDLDGITRAELLGGIVRQHERINATLTALYDLAKGELQSSDSMKDVDLCELVENVVEGLRSAYPATQLEMHMPDTVMVKVWPEGLELAIRNLVLNGIKHGGSNVIVRVANDATVVVDDNGPGVPEPERQRVFERFARNPNHGGSGLGLALVKQQAELHGGSVTIEDGPLGGARFVLSMNKSAGYEGKNS